MRTTSVSSSFKYRGERSCPSELGQTNNNAINAKIDAVGNERERFEMRFNELSPNDYGNENCDQFER